MHRILKLITMKKQNVNQILIASALETSLSVIDHLRMSGRVSFHSALYGYLHMAYFALSSAIDHIEELK